VTFQSILLRPLVAAALAAVLLLTGRSPGMADETRVVMQDGVAYRELTRNSRVPTTRYETREEQQTALIEQTRTYEQTYTRTLYQPMVQQWHRPQTTAFPNGAPMPVVSSQVVAVTRWIPRQETIKVPLVTREIRPAVRTIAYQERILGFEEQPMVVAREVAPEYSDRDVGPLANDPSVVAGMPPVAADYLANGQLWAGRDANGWPNGYSALNGTHYQLGYGAGFPTASQSGWGQPALAGTGRPVVASNAWPTNDWSTSGWPGAREISPYAGRGRGSWSALFPAYDTSSRGPFGGFGRNLWSRLTAKGTLADFNNSSTSSLSPMGNSWLSPMPNTPPTNYSDAFAPPTTSYLPTGSAVPDGPGYLGRDPAMGLNNPMAPPATRSGLSADLNSLPTLPTGDLLNGPGNNSFIPPLNDGVAPPG
jgi:hypothetical protein